jgi:putative transcriptional regulator
MSNNRLSSFYDSETNLVGKLLVASPRVPAGFPFGRTVVLVLQHNHDGVFGVVLNRPASAEMQVAWQQAVGQSLFAEEKLVSGGPVQGPVLAIHREAELAEVEIQGGLFVSVQKDAIEQLRELELYEDSVPYRIVLGAVNWPPSQLQNEIDNGAWFLVDAEPELIFSDPTALWEQSVRLYGADSIRRITGITDFPADPLLN